MSAVSGSFAELEALAKRIAAVAGEGAEGRAFQSALLANLGQAALRALDDQFIASVDPYGNAWAPLKQRTGKPLEDTGRLASGFSHHAIDKGFAIETNIAYARTHQLGAGVPGSPIGPIRPVEAKRLAWRTRDGARHFAAEVRIPRRQMIPQADTGGMGRWGDALNEEADEFMRDWLK